MFNYCINLNLLYANFYLFYSDFLNKNFKINVCDLIIYKFDKSLKVWKKNRQENSKLVIAKKDMTYKRHNQYLFILKEQAIKEKGNLIHYQSLKNKKRNLRTHKREMNIRRNRDKQCIQVPAFKKEIVEEPIKALEDRKTCLKEPIKVLEEKKTCLKELARHKCNQISSIFKQVEGHLNILFGLEAVIQHLISKRDKYNDYYKKYHNWALNKLITTSKKYFQDKHTRSEDQKNEKNKKK